MSDIERTNKIVPYESEGLNAAVVAIELDGRRYLFSGDISTFNLETMANEVGALWPNLPSMTYSHDLTVHFVGEVNYRVQEVGA